MDRGRTTTHSAERTRGDPLCSVCARGGRYGVLYSLEMPHEVIIILGRLCERQQKFVLYVHTKYKKESLAKRTRYGNS